MEEVVIMQGDQYSLQLVPVDAEDNVIPHAEIEDIEIMVGCMRKTMSDGEIIYNEDENIHLYPLSQSETFGMAPGVYKIQARIKSRGGFVVGNDHVGNLKVEASRSKEAL